MTGALSGYCIGHGEAGRGFTILGCSVLSIAKKVVSLNHPSFHNSETVYHTLYPSVYDRKAVYQTLYLSVHNSETLYHTLNKTVHNSETLYRILYPSVHNIETEYHTLYPNVHNTETLYHILYPSVHNSEPVYRELATSGPSPVAATPAPAAGPQPQCSEESRLIHSLHDTDSEAVTLCAQACER